MNPLIGVISAVDAEKTTSVFPSYVRCIERAGGIPVILPYTEEEAILEQAIARCDGILFSGGVDISPARYGEEPLPLCGIPSLPFDEFAFSAFDAATRSGKPILGICRGAQMINVAWGGSLYQDLPTQCPSPIFHAQREGKFEFSHEISLTEGEPLHRLLGKTRIRGNSFHHQAVKELGEGLRVMARADDGTVEAIYAPSHPYLFGLQWHPERLIDIDEDSRAIFSHFIQVCMKKRSEA